MSERKEKTDTGLEPNIAGLLCYILGWVTGIIFLILERKNEFVRFHAMQSIATFGALTVALIIFSFIPLVGWILGGITWVLGFILWIMLMIKAFQGQSYKLPWVGNYAEKQV